MLRSKINDSWMLAKGGTSMMSSLQGGLEYEEVNLPHDAMVHEERTPDTANGTQTGYWPGGLYTYTKKLYAPEEWKDKTARCLRDCNGICEWESCSNKFIWIF